VRYLFYCFSIVLNISSLAHKLRRNNVTPRELISLSGIVTRHNAVVPGPTKQDKVIIPFQVDGGTV
jgi:hypothetical protein